MDLTREEAVRLFHEQWSDMQKDLGDRPTSGDRLTYKRQWCLRHGMSALSSCFLCEYVRQEMTRQGIVGILLCCHACPIAWPTWNGTCCGKRLADGDFIKDDYYLAASISQILSLPEREVVLKREQEGGEDG